MGWKAHAGPQTDVLKKKSFEIMYGGARGGGKTDAGLAWMSRYAKHPSYRGLVIRRNAEDLSDWISRARNFYAPLKAKFAGTTPVIKFPWGSFIKTGHLKDENAFEKYQGHEYQKILVEELTQIPKEENYLKLISSCRTTVPELRPGVFSTSNPGGPGHVWVKQRFVDVARNKQYVDPVSGRTRIFIPAKIEDNPTLMENDPSYVHFLDSLPEELRKAWRDGDWDIFAGQYFKKLRREKHLIEPFRIPDGWMRFRSLDWGFKHQTVVLWWAVDFEGNAYIYKCYDLAGQVVSKMADNVLAMTNNERKIATTVSDPAIWVVNPYKEARAENTMADEIRNAGLFIEKANNDRVNGWQALRELIEWNADKEPRLKIFNTCPQVFDGLVSLVHDDKRPEDVLKTDGDDYGDSARYGAMHIYSALDQGKKLTPEEKFIESIIDDTTFLGESQQDEWSNI